MTSGNCIYYWHTPPTADEPAEGGCLHADNATGGCFEDVCPLSTPVTLDDLATYTADLRYREMVEG